MRGQCCAITIGEQIAHCQIIRHSNVVPGQWVMVDTDGSPYERARDQFWLVGQQCNGVVLLTHKQAKAVKARTDILLATDAVQRAIKALTQPQLIMPKSRTRVRQRGSGWGNIEPSPGPGHLPHYARPIRMHTREPQGVGLAYSRQFERCLHFWTVEYWRAEDRLRDYSADLYAVWQMFSREDMSCTQIARALGISPAAARQRKTRAMKFIRSALAEYEKLAKSEERA